MKIGEIEEQARNILLDTYEDAYRFEPKEVYLALRDAMKYIRTIRPESRYVNGFLVDKMLVDQGTEKDFGIITPSTDLDSYRDYSLNMEDRWSEACVYYVVHRMYLKDDSDTQNAGLADRYLQMFNSSVVS